ncbi:conserved exported hypothetical protein [uncultured Gammaproteobacteria bacterium]
MIIRLLVALMVGWAGLAVEAQTLDGAGLRRQGDQALAAGNPVLAVQWYRAAGERGDAAAQTTLGWLFRDGKGVYQDHVEALRLFRAAAGQGYAGAEFSLGTMYEHGRGVVQDHAEAVRWYRKAADQGNAGAQNNLGWLYQNGQGVTQDYGEAARWFRKAAEQEQPDAQANLGVLYLNGWGVSQDQREAARLLRLAASQGDLEARAIYERLKQAQAQSREQTAQAERARQARDQTRDQVQPQPQFQPQPESPRVFGLWRSVGPVVDIGLQKMFLKLDVAAQSVTFRYDCRYLDGSILAGSFVTRAEVGTDRIRILERGQSRVGSAENDCTVSIVPITLPYSLRGDELMVTFKDRTVAMKRGG